MMVLLLYCCFLLLLSQVGRTQAAKAQAGKVQVGNAQLVVRANGGVSSKHQFCTWPCKCGPRPHCAPGVSAVLDGCGCCKSCARQIREQCNERDVCDPHKGMYCDFSQDKPRYRNGVCAYMMAVGCDLSGAHYENGEAFQPNSLYKCTCIGGAIGCTPIFIQKPAAMLGPAPLQSKNTPVGLRAKSPQDSKYKSKSAYRDPPLVRKKSCLVQTTPWSPCTRSCGFGISTRISNDNGKCKMKKERRLCLLRPCDKRTIKNLKVQNNVKTPAGKSCKAMFQAQTAEKFKLSGCLSTKKYKPQYCGMCSNKRSCVPNRSTVVKVDFKCAGGASVQWKMQWITSCVCLKKWNDPGDVFSQLYLL